MFPTNKDRKLRVNLFQVNLQFFECEILKSVAEWRSSLFVFVPANLATCSVKQDNID